jgi:protein-disulfide isomerase/rhodanese-related sulfurtransferase
MRKLILLALSLIGIFDSAFLWWSYTSPDHPMVCVGNGCDLVRASSYAHLWGLPLPVFGVAMYVTLVLLVFAQDLAGPSIAGMVRYAIAGISGLGFLTSVYLSGIEAFVLHAWCVWCVVSAVAVTAIFILALPDVFHASAPPQGGDAIVALRRSFVLLVAAVLVGVPAFLLLARAEKLPPTPTAPAAILDERLVRPDSHVYGNPDSPVTVVEFGDFQCPYCRTAEKTAREIREAYARHVRFVFRQFPIAAIHPYAEKAAEASECAGEQGEFWPAFDKLYEGQADLTEAALKRYARELGLNMPRFNQCLSTGAMKPRVERDIEDARAIGVSRTPTFFIDGKKFEGGLDYAQFSQLLNQQLALHGVTTREEAQQGATPAGGPASAGPAASAASTALSAKTSAAAPSLLGNPNANIFSQGSSSLAACSEDEAGEQQPTLIDTAQARRLFEDGSKALFVDVRPASAFHKARIPGAINMPVEEIEKNWSRLPKDRSIVLYESGRTASPESDPCAAGRAAGRFLLTHGFSPRQVRVYRDGLAAWEKAGLPVEPHRPPST